MAFRLYFYCHLQVVGLSCATFEVMTAVAMKSNVFWYMTSCNVVDFSGRFGETYRLHLQGRRLSRVISKIEVFCLLTSHTLRP
jgi:hypothetical protein